MREGHRQPDTTDHGLGRLSCKAALLQLSVSQEAGGKARKVAATARAVNDAHRVEARPKKTKWTNTLTVLPDFMNPKGAAQRSQPNGRVGY